MPKRKAPTRLSGLTGSDDEDIMQMTTNETAQESRAEPPAKKRRGRPRSSNESAPEPKPTTQTRKRESSIAQKAEPPATRKTTRRGRPRGSSQTEAAETQPQLAATQEESDEESYEQEIEDPTEQKETKPTHATRAAKPVPARRKAPGVAKQVIADGEFEYTPSGSRHAAIENEPAEEAEPSPRPRGAQRRLDATEATDVVDESIIAELPTHPSERSSEAKNILAQVRNVSDISPRKRKSIIDAEQGGDPELRRKIGDLTKKHDTLESKFRNLREIGIVEANTNMEKLRKQCDTITTASNELVFSLRSELAAQKSLGQQSRGLQKQLKEKDAEIARLQEEAAELRAQYAASQTENKALQTKLAAARNTAASLENTVKVPGSAMKGGPANRAVAAANAEAAQAAQIAQIREDLYSDLTGLIIRDVKSRETDHLYDCIQTGVNGTLHFKLVVPKVASADYEKAVFEYLPLLDANRDRELVDILPDFLIDHITFDRDQAPKFYTRVIDALTKRRSSSVSRA
ncbi:uncharacterized protein N7483_005678 [Penicillium malachiteum]|uniref:uncharacterized protein n=1 Tax=Penicillium malachiteum TaxID=1324776 RepID=UPI0025494406|nr:uncharacterized protein N7483_005678 [Penicillium malachiteum]KAJ5731170.1 hypothetical protein N7483_005678 [Penicillium malachiteum]